jgi:hypothetical protein
MSSLLIISNQPRKISDGLRIRRQQTSERAMTNRATAKQFFAISLLIGAAEPRTGAIPLSRSGQSECILRKLERKDESQ